MCHRVAQCKKKFNILLYKNNHFLLVITAVEKFPKK